MSELATETQAESELGEEREGDLNDEGHSPSQMQPGAPQAVLGINDFHSFTQTDIAAIDSESFTNIIQSFRQVPFHFISSFAFYFYANLIF